MLIVRYFAGIMVWAAILLYIVLLFLLASFVLKKGNEYTDKGEIDKGKNLTYTGYIIYAIAGLSILMIICFFRKI